MDFNNKNSNKSGGRRGHDRMVVGFIALTGGIYPWFPDKLYCIKTNFYSSMFCIRYIGIVVGVTVW